MIAFNNLAVVVAFTFLLSTLGLAAPAPSPDNAVNTNVDIARRLVDSIGAKRFVPGDSDSDDLLY